MNMCTHVYCAYTHTNTHEHVSANTGAHKHPKTFFKEACQGDGIVRGVVGRWRCWEAVL